ncbi:uncharacterized protein ATC70_008634 [Mucor velutinosus]|uniref:Uncharacterized protein n=1 Tax=Mucor velutinosus TaxID=708070 RepID=A0AAN7DJ58_9FUNG|nr:hypothetical protein ATC70_008634 [Mucor velutinosus]
MLNQCRYCSDLFETKGKRDSHTLDQHVSTVIVGETNVSRTASGFPCPRCRKSLKSAKTLKIHLAKKQLPCLFVYDSAPQSDPRESLSLKVEPDALTNTATTAETTSSVNISKESPLIESTASNVSTASTLLLTSSPTSSTLSSSIVLDELSFSPPPMEDRLLFNSIDVSAQFYKFQLDAQSRLREDAAFTIEEHMQHILALSSVLLLKPARTHEDLHRHIDLNTCEGLRRHILSKQQTAYQPFPTSTRNRLEEIMGQMDLDGDRNNICTRLGASRQISAMIQEDGLNSTNRILLAVRNMTSVSDEEKQATTRPDASINITNGAALSKRIGCGEVKAQYQALNHRLVGIDLMRITVLAKAASDKHKLKEIFTFTVVGKYATFYIFTRAQAYLYTMCEIAHIQLPLTLDHVPLFLSQLDKVVRIISCFQYTLNSGNHSYANDPFTLTDNMLHNATDPKSSRKRKSITSHYNH